MGQIIAESRLHISDLAGYDSEANRKVEESGILSKINDLQINITLAQALEIARLLPSASQASQVSLEVNLESFNAS